MLALRYRKATLEELHYFGKIPPQTSRSLSFNRIPPKATEASDINLANIQEKKILQSYTKRDKDNTIKVRKGWFGGCFGVYCRLVFSQCKHSTHDTNKYRNLT